MDLYFICTNVIIVAVQWTRRLFARSWHRKDTDFSEPQDNISTAYECVLDDSALSRLVHALDQYLDGAQVYVHNQATGTNLGALYAGHRDE